VTTDTRLSKRSTSGNTQRKFPAAFYHLLVNTLVVAVIDFTVWFAITFFVFLQTQSVFATGMIAGVYLLFTATSGVWFGSLVDHHRKKTVMMAATGVSLVFYLAAIIIERTASDGAFASPRSVPLWILILTCMFGVIAGNIRTIAMPTIVTLLIPAGRRDKANGLVGSATGVSFLVTSVISGILVDAGGMFYVLLLGIGTNLLALIHLLPIRVVEKRVLSNPDHAQGVDLRGTLKIVRNVPGLPALVLFGAFNNCLHGVFMALMDAYGLSLMSATAWGLMWGALSTVMIIGGLVVAKVGLGSNPVRLLLLGNVVVWSTTMLFPLQSSILLLAIGMAVFMLMMPVIESAEQTVLQRVVPYERQGRVFGFAQSVELGAAPLIAFLIGPITEFLVIPFMSGDGAGARLIGSWFGTGPARGIALVFIIAACIGLAITLLALSSKYYRNLSRSYADAVERDERGENVEKHSESEDDTRGLSYNEPVIAERSDTSPR
jgi:DHA3 family multidrug efflux protein-like MFS transporter